METGRRGWFSGRGREPKGSQHEQGPQDPGERVFQVRFEERGMLVRDKGTGALYRRNDETKRWTWVPNEDATRGFSIDPKSISAQVLNTVADSAETAMQER